MQLDQDGSDQGACSSADYGSLGVLEDPSEIEIYNDGRVMALLQEPYKGLSSQGVYSKDSFAARLYKYRRLLFSHTGALLLLQGMTVSQILGPEWVLISGVHRSPYDPRPGIDKVLIAHLEANPGRLPPEQVFFLVRQALKI